MKILLLILLILATGIIGLWLFLLTKVTQEDWVSGGYSKIVDNIIKIEKLKIKQRKKEEIIKNTHGIKKIILEAFLRNDIEKKINKLEKQISEIQEGNFRCVNIITMPGYVVFRNVEIVAKGDIHKSLLMKNYELYGKKYAPFKAQGIIASTASFLILGLGLSLTIGVTIMSQGQVKEGSFALLVGVIFVIVLAYGTYSEVDEDVKRRRYEIERQFPSMVSKLALLVSSGMIINRAWKETAYSEDKELYKEMQITSEELDNLVSPEIAYTNFIKRCNTKETSKIASAIIQSISKGNAEMGALLREMAKEAWIERKHLAKRDSEKANAKLMIPTMLLLLTVLVMIMVPIATSFNSF